MEDKVIYTFPAELLPPICRLEAWPQPFDYYVRHVMQRYGIRYEDRDKAEAIVNDAYNAARTSPLCWIAKKKKVVMTRILYLVSAGFHVWAITVDRNGWVIVKRFRKDDIHEYVSTIQYVTGYEEAKVVVIDETEREVIYGIGCRK